MKLLITTIVAVLLVGCGDAQQSAPTPEAEPAEPVAEAAQPAQSSKPLSEADIALLEAASEGNVKAVKQHLADGVDVNAKDEDGWTSLHYATTGLTRRVEIVELLIDAGADVNAKDVSSWTPLHGAAQSLGHKEIAELLITAGAAVNTKSENGGTPLDITISSKIRDLLLKHGGKTGAELEAEGK